MSMILSNPISIFNNRYKVYPNGKVYSVKRRAFLTPSFNKTLNDYTYYLTISENIPKLFFATSLVYNSFHPGMYDRTKHRIVRIDGNKKNFKLENLKLLTKDQYFHFVANKVYKAGDYKYRNEIYADIPNVNFHKISESGKVLSFIKGKPHLCKARKAKDGSDLISITVDYRRQKSIYPESLAKKVFKEK
jgi:hypothetical protein